MSDTLVTVEEKFVFSRLREAIEWACVTGIGAGLMSLVRSQPLQGFLELWGACAAGVFLVNALQPRRAVIVSESALTVPAGWRRTRSVSLADIDHVRSSSPSRWDRLSGQRVIYTRHGAKVWLSLVELGPSKVQRVLKLIGCG
jgi:hypothetical protein